MIRNKLIMASIFFSFNLLSFPASLPASRMRKEVQMARDVIDTLVVGAGQAGVAMSEHLGRAGVSHLVLERDGIAERWRFERLD